MSDVRYYEIEIKQGDLRINLSSDDVYFISKQMDKWFRVLLDDSYVPIQVPPSPTRPPAPPPVAAPPAPEPAPVPQPEPLPPQPEPVVQAPAPEPPPLPPAPPPMPEPVLPPPPPPVAPQPEPAPAPPREKLDSAVQDDFEAVMDTLMKDLEKSEGAPAPYQATGGVLPQPAANYELPPMPEAPIKLDLSHISTLSDLTDRSRAATSEDYLLLTSFYLTELEHCDKFSLKRINSQLVKSGLTPVNHSVLEASIGKNYLALVPDLTGMADVSEYSLTEEGQQQVHRLVT